jgi:hypothetical protein
MPPYILHDKQLTTFLLDIHHINPYFLWALLRDFNRTIVYIQMPFLLNFDYIISILKMAVTLFELYVLYAVLQRFLKLKHIGSLFKDTSLSVYWRRYRAPGIF